MVNRTGSFLSCFVAPRHCKSDATDDEGPGQLYLLGCAEWIGGGGLDQTVNAGSTQDLDAALVTLHPRQRW